MSTRVGINGFGRIGRAVLRSAIERNAGLEVVAVHDVAAADVLAHLLERDSIYGRFAHPVRVEDGALVVADRRIKVVDERGPRAVVGGAGRRRRHRGHWPASHAHRRRPPHRRRCPQGDHVRPDQGP